MTTIDLMLGEKILKEGVANHLKGKEAVGGKLFVTDRRLYFSSHPLNLQTHQESYALNDISALEFVNTLFVVPNGLLVKLRDGREERFVLNGRDDWKKAIEDAQRQSPPWT